MPTQTMEHAVEAREQITTLSQEADTLYNLALTAAEAGDIEKATGYEKEADEKRAEVETIKSGLEAIERLGDKKEDIRNSRLPAQFPAGADTPDPIKAGAAPNEGGDEPPLDREIKNVYQLRFSDEDASILAVLKDLHGKNFEQERIAQWGAFDRYLRNYKVDPTGEDLRLLSKVVIGPSQALSAINGGLDVKTMQKTLIEAVGSLGGYVVPVDFQEDVIRRLMGFTALRERARVSQTDRDRVEIPRFSGGDTQYTTSVRVTWVDEVPVAGTSDTELTWDMVGIPVNTVMAETYLSRNLLEDAALDLADELANSYAESQGIDEDNRFVTGTGAGTPRGILVAGTAPETGVGTVNSGAATTLTPDGVIDLSYGIASQYRQNAVWILARTTLGAIRKFKDGSGRYLWEPALQEGQPDMLLGRPVVEQEIMPAVAAGTYPIIFGDPQGYRIVDRIGMTVERYLGGEEARRNRVLYVMRRRVGGQVTNPERFNVQLISA